MEMGDLRELAGHMSLVTGRSLPQPRQPELRRPPRDAVSLYGIRVDRGPAKPLIWRGATVVGVEF
jgi:hypothetical protein